MEVTDFKEERRKGLGGTDMGAVLGVNPYKTAYQVYLEKVEGIEQDLSDNEAVVWGNLLEDAIAQRYQELYPPFDGLVHFYKPSYQLNHSAYPYLIANPDRLITLSPFVCATPNADVNAIPMPSEGLEIKTVGAQSAYQWGESGSQLIPGHYYVQIAHYMLVCDIPIWNVAALIGGQELRTYRFERDKEIDGFLIEAGTKFWKEHVEKRGPPPIDYSHKAAQEFIKKRYKAVSEETVVFPEEYLKWKQAYLESKKQLKYWQDKAAEAQTFVLEQLKDAGIGIFSDGSKFIRKLIKVKSYTVPEREYIRLDFKENEGE